MATRKTLKEVEQIVRKIFFLDRTFRVLEKGDGFLLQLQYLEPDVEHPEKGPTLQRSRKYYVSPWSTETEIVETAFLACLRSMNGFAMKATWVEVDGEGRDIYKTPKTDDGTKNSARGRLAVVRDPLDGKLKLVERATPAEEIFSLLCPVWRDGKELSPETFDAIRARARATL